MSTTIRPLASSERGFVAPAPTTCTWELTLRGRLDLDALGAAFVALRAAHPALDARISATGEDVVFVTPEAAPGDIFTIDRVATLPDSSPLLPVDPTAALIRLHVETAGDRHRMTWSLNHALADGAFLTAVLMELWTRYTSVVETGSVGDVVRHAFPASAQDVLRQVATGADTGRERLDEIRWYGAAPTLPARSPRLPDVTSLLFSEEVTAGFVAASAGIGLNALISGVLLCAERAGFVDESPGTEIPVGAMTLVNMRRRISPALSPIGVTNFVGASFAAPRLTLASDPATVGAALVAQLRDDLATGRCLNVLAHPAMPDPTEQPVVLSNLGSLALELPAGLTGESLRMMLSMDSTLLHAPAGPRRPSPSATIYQILTFADRLGIEAITLGGTASARSRAAVSERLIALVHSVARVASAA